MRFLLVEDSADLARAVLDRLALDGHVVDHAADLGTAEDFMSVSEYDLILLDIMLPDGDGRTFLQNHRAAAGQTPVIVLTARSEVSDRVGVLDLGADDYITKPFDFAELEARVRAVMRRHAGTARNVIHLAGLSFDPLSGTLQTPAGTLELRNREMRLLEVFVNAPERLFSKANLVDRLFSYEDDVSENAIEVYVGRLRKRLEGTGVRIVTVRGVGYRLTTE